MRKFSLGLHAKGKKYETEGVDGYDWNEAQPKWPITRIVNTAFTVISIIVWVLILFRIFSSGNGEYEKMILLNDRAQEHYPGDSAQVLRINSQTSKEEGGEVVVQYPVYLEKAQNLQLTARVNRRTLPPKSGETGYTFVIRESGKETRFFPVSYYKMDKQFQYSFFRVCFEGVELDTKKVYTLLVFQGEVKPEDGAYPSSKAAYRFTLLDSDTYCNPVTPQHKVYETVEDQ